MEKRKRWFLIAVVVSPLLSLAFLKLSAPGLRETACDTEVDLRGPGQVMEDYPQGHQGFGRTNLCGFYTAASLMDSWRFRAGERSSAGAGGRVNPVALAVELARDRDVPIWMPIQNTTDGLNNRKGRWGSVVCSIIDYARENGACADDPFSTLSWREQGEYADRNIRLYDLLFQYGMLSEPERADALDEVSRKVHEAYTSLPHLTSNPLSLAAVRALIQQNERKPYRTIATLLHARCQTQRVALSSYPRCRSAYYAGLDILGVEGLAQDPLRTDSALRQILSHLDATNPLPVSIAYCSRLMWEGHAFSKRSILSSGCSPHWALVIGKKKINGQCHLLIRNTSKPEQGYSSDWVQDEMDVWIEAQALQRTIYSVQWLEVPVTPVYRTTQFAR